jgi:hypothetical protein
MNDQVLLLLGSCAILLVVIVSLLGKLGRIEEARRKHTRLPR